MLPLILLAAALPPRPVFHAFVPATPAPITITPDIVDLDGAGRFDFEPDSRAFNVEPPAGGDGLSLTVRLWFDANGKPVSCDVGQSPLPDAAKTGCAQLMRSARFSLFPGMAMPLRRGFVDVEFSFFKNPPGAPAAKQMYAFAYPGYVNTTIDYPPIETPVDQLLKKEDGSFNVSIGIDDYPAIAMRYHLESHSAALLGISRDGQVKTCRPVSTKGLQTAFLDNQTCIYFLRRGHFDFSPGAPIYDGLRYLRKATFWVNPQ
ncbi:hypothetical protein [Flavisphingomonas formosensis]|uniref:hypothetical protein n=1 Tax=Flavisphingomonas formosensis TaxID=861534 RepID=UPI0012F87D16|nr:hypothetical protein [Sphingomonas formosensis]